MDHLAVANWMFMCVNSGEDDDQPDPPKPVPRPGVAGEEGEKRGERSTEDGAAEVVSPGELARFFG
ncbi:hypothetical protein [Streptomyces sp. NPDC056463]|uniref:hypothetical protein n=1 Tax=unclassified Streptomyces TaxID=2593676 RepID=UPI00369F9D2B